MAMHETCVCAATDFANYRYVDSGLLTGCSDGQPISFS